MDMTTDMTADIKADNQFRRNGRRYVRSNVRSRVRSNVRCHVIMVCALLGAVAAEAGAQSAFLDTLQRRTFDWFWETTNPRNGLVPDRWPTKSFSSVAAVGFGLTAYPIGVERRWITRDQARERVLTTLRFFW